jgi:hypothetical protein
MLQLLSFWEICFGEQGTCFDSQAASQVCGFPPAPAMSLQGQAPFILPLSLPSFVKQSAHGSWNRSLLFEDGPQY